MIRSTSSEYMKPHKATDLFSVAFLCFVKQKFTFPEPLTQHLNFYFAEQPVFPPKCLDTPKNIFTELLGLNFKMLAL